MVDHGERAHALLSASGAERWLNCPPSARLEDDFEETTSVYAEEGTLAHEFADIGLRKYNKEITAAQYNKAFAELQKHDLYAPEMDEEVAKYIDFITAEMKSLKRKKQNPELLVEQKVDLTDIVPESFGTCDAVIITPTLLKVRDLKYGKGVEVSAKENSQLMLYAYGALMEYELLYDIETVELGIIQPRLNHISEWSISADELRKWGEEYVKPKAQQAFEGKGVQKSGKHCRWCRAKARCATLAANNIKMAEKVEFKGPAYLNDEQMLDVYGKLSQITDWANSIADYMLAEAVKGKVWRGLKVVEGRSNRKFTDEDKVAQILKKELFTDDQIFERKMLTLSKLEKLVGKKDFSNLLGDLIIKPEGKPTLVDESDRRPPMNSAADDFADDLPDLPWDDVSGDDDFNDILG